MPKFVPATITELSRVALLSGLSGEKLTEIARRMDHEEVPPGRQVVREGGPASASTSCSPACSPSARRSRATACAPAGRLLGEVALAMSIPRTASVRALTPAVVAS